MRVRRFGKALAVLVAGAALAAPAASTAGLQINVLSTRADLVSGGQALVSIDLPSPADASRVTVSLNGADVTGRFATRPNGAFEGLLGGLAEGSNTVTAALPGGPSTSLTVIDHPNGGPVFSGPQLQPWPCPPGAVDAQCNAPTAYAYEYMSASGGDFKPYDPDNPPSDVATTTTQTGKTVPFVVRV